MGVKPLDIQKSKNGTHGRIWAWALGACLVLEVVLIGVAGIVSDLAQPGNPWRFVALVLAAGAFYLVAVRLFENVPHVLRRRFFWSAAIVLRLAVLWMVPADDFWRYLWEGRIQSEGFNPYVLAPDAEALEPLRDENWEPINQKDWRTIYPPGAQILFARLASISPTANFFRLAFSMAELLTLFLLLRINTGSGRFRASAWYAWNPAVVIFLIGAVHFDAVMIAAMVGAVWALHRANPMGRTTPAWSWALLSVVLLGLAISIKIIPILLLPVWIFALRSRAWVALIALLVPLGLTWLYGGPATVLEPLRNFGSFTRFNELLWWLPALFVEGYHENTVYNILLVAIVCLIAIVLRRDWRRACLWVLGAALILSPVLHPWYVTWILPLAAWRKAHAWFVLSLSVVVALLVWEPGPWWYGWQITWPIRFAVIAPPLAALAWSRWRHRNDEPGAA